jgi:hypothetical protein
MQFRFLRAELVKTLGLSVEKTKGKTVDSVTNGRHFEIKGLTGPKAVAMLRQMRGRVEVISNEAILHTVLLGLRRGFWKSEHVSRSELVKALGKRHCQECQARAPAPT